MLELVSCHFRNMNRVVTTSEEIPRVVYKRIRPHLRNDGTYEITEETHTVPKVGKTLYVRI